MLLKRVIPCLDVDKGRAVKGTNFVDIRDAGAKGIPFSMTFKQDGVEYRLDGSIGRK